MNDHTDIHLVPTDTRQKTLDNTSIMDHAGKALDEDSPPENSFTPNVHLNLIGDSHDIEAHAGQGSIHPFENHSNIQPAENRINREYCCTNPQTGSDQIDLPAISEEVLSVTSPGGSTLGIYIDGLKVPFVSSQEPSLRPGPVSPMNLLCDDEGDIQNHALKLHAELDSIQDADLTDGETKGEYHDNHHLCENWPSSLPPSSSPPQLFSSPPCASSQSSDSDDEPSKMVLRAVEDFANSRVALVAQDEFHESQHLQDDTADVATSPGANKYLEMDSTSYAEGPGLSKKRAAPDDSDESYKLQSAKRPKPDCRFYPPPAPMRATPASQNRQFKKLTAPFRPPSKLPVARDGPVQIVNNEVTESASRSATETSNDKPIPREPAMHVSPVRHKASNTSRSVTQFKSPLVNKALPAGSRTIRLTPTLQALERKLQLLKRAIKVKENNEEEVLVRLAKKWTEAGREVAYDVWDASKDAGDFGGKGTLAQRPYDRENTNGGSMSWGWDTKHGNADEESCDPNLSMASCAAGRLTLEEGDDAGFDHTLGTMLRQLGIAPEIFGWDDDKESFSD